MPISLRHARTAALLLCLLLASVGAGATSAVASTATIEVTVTDDRTDGIACPAAGDDVCTLREAVNVAGDGATILLPEDEEDDYLVESPIEITAAITIRGASHDIVVRPNEDHAHRIFDINADGGTVTIETLTLEAGGGEGHADLGGAIYVTKANRVLIHSVEMRDNNLGSSGNAYGGALAVVSDDAEIGISSSTFRNNTSAGGGAIYLSASQDIHISDTTFVNNETIGPATNGGALLVDHGGRIRITSSLFQGNNANFAGGAFHLSGTSSVEVTNSTFLSSSTSGGVAATDGSGNSLTLRHVTIAEHGSAFSIGGGDTVRVLDSALSNVAGCDGVAETDGSITDSSASAACVTDAENVDGDLDVVSGLHAPLLTPGPDSPLNNAAVGDCPDKDQRGESRTSPCTVGAVEVAGIVCPPGELPRDTEIWCDLDVALAGADTSVHVQLNPVLFDDAVDLTDGAGSFSFVIPGDEPETSVHVSVEGGVYHTDLPVVPIGGGGGSGGGSGSGGGATDGSVVDGGGPDGDSVVTTLAFTGAGTPLLTSLGIAMILAGLIGVRTTGRELRAARADHGHRAAGRGE